MADDAYEYVAVGDSLLAEGIRISVASTEILHAQTMITSMPSIAL
jgi:hypothetical protein